MSLLFSDDLACIATDERSIDAVGRRSRDRTEETL